MLDLRPALLVSNTGGGVGVGLWGHSPVVPIVTVVTANHRAPIIRLVAPWTDPDLIAPLITDLVVKCRVETDGVRERSRRGQIRMYTIGQQARCIH